MIVPHIVPGRNDHHSESIVPVRNEHTERGAENPLNMRIHTIVPRNVPPI